MRALLRVPETGVPGPAAGAHAASAADDATSHMAGMATRPVAAIRNDGGQYSTPLRIEPVVLVTLTAPCALPRRARPKHIFVMAE